MARFSPGIVVARKGIGFIRSRIGFESHKWTRYIFRDEVVYSTERKTIKELRAAADVGFYVVLATVLDVEPVLSWWYKSCVCSVRAEANADTYFCDGCNKDANNVVNRYKLNLLVFDGTATTTFVVFNKEVAALFGRTCTEMVKELNVCGFYC
ncbi:uncharacterized protein DS421_2g46050 [Arachis hypogaea]|nr:uncharacterized protein DS421_2g46050 [Arachis hypogaea]